MSSSSILVAQARMAIVVALRTPRTLLFTAAFPLLFLVLFNSIFAGEAATTTLPGDVELSVRAYFTAGIAAYTVGLSTFTTLAVNLTTQREKGQLKRYRGTPMPPWTFIAAQVCRAALQALAMTAILLAVGALAYGVEVPLTTLPALVLYVVVGTAALCSLGIALTPLTPTVDAASAIAPFAVVTLAFFSGIWIPIETLPSGLRLLGEVFPLSHLALGLQTTLSPETSGSGLEAVNLAVLLGWGVAGALAASRWFRWEPLTARQ